MLSEGLTSAAGGTVRREQLQKRKLNQEMDTGKARVDVVGFCEFVFRKLRS